VKAAVGIPVVANGDIDSPEKARDVLAQTGADAVMIGRAAQGRPWIFREVDHYLAHGTRLPAPTWREVRDLLLEHLNDHYRFYGEFTGVRTARKHIGWYLQALCGDRQPDEATEALRHAINDCEQADGQVRLLERYFADRASLLDTGIDQGGIQPS